MANSMHDYTTKNGGVYTWKVMSAADQTAIENEKERMQTSALPVHGDRMAYGELTIATHGSDNMLPTRVGNLYKKNDAIPEILKKKVTLMYGKGIGLFEITEEDVNGETKEVRRLVSSKYPKVNEWLNSWETAGLPNLRTYLKGVMTSYFYHEMYYSHPRLNNSSYTGGRLPVRGLVHFPVERCRLALQGLIGNTVDLEDAMLTHVVYNNWSHPYRYDTQVYDRFDPANPLKSATAIMPVRDFGVGEEIYATPTGYYGLEPWINAANLNAPYINSFLKNSFAARKHINIPNAWFKSKENTLKAICKANQGLEQDGKPLQTEYEGLTGIGTIFSHRMVSKLVELKMEALANVMSGEGKNQGKTFYTRSFLTDHGIEKWEIIDIETKYADFIKSITTVDNHALKKILAGIGMDPALTNVSNEGIFNSGSQVYYAYLVYLEQQHLPEEIILQELNRALHINFPELKKKGIEARFKRFAPPRQEETKPTERLEKNTK